ncbi:MAG TPA: DUF2147 domain-containing protein [Rhodopila sp.]|jgi:uncharacterized protein (DUF2147 family)|nr:DUF2147 domain-containing protein [Rhodopila sp.]
MTLRFLSFVLLFLQPLQLSEAAPSVTGFWLTQGRDGVIAIAPCGTYLCAYIAGVFLDHPTDPIPVDHRGVSQCGLPLITDARQIQPDLWKGHIINPRNGEVWGVEFNLDPLGNLALRGFLGVPLLGRTQTWTRYPGTPPADCRITTMPEAGR